MTLHEHHKQVKKQGKKGSATFCAEGCHRYDLHRALLEVRPLDEGHYLGALNFVMLNPSTADQDANDPTITRCMGFGVKWGYAPLVVTNIFGYRATEPDQLRAIGRAEAIGVGNDDAIIYAARHAGLVVAAWGKGGDLHDRGREVITLLGKVGIEVQCLGTNFDGSPKHPLYLKADSFLVPYV